MDKATLDSILDKGYEIHYIRKFDSNKGFKLIQISVSVNDTDGLPLFGIFCISVEEWMEKIKPMGGELAASKILDEYIIRRHSQDINTCQHDITIFQDKRYCIRCLVPAGAHIDMQISHN